VQREVGDAPIMIIGTEREMVFRENDRCVFEDRG
jgi:hypothetical protein